MATIPRHPGAKDAHSLSPVMSGCPRLDPNCLRRAAGLITTSNHDSHLPSLLDCQGVEYVSQVALSCQPATPAGMHHSLAGVWRQTLRLKEAHAGLLSFPLQPVHDRGFAGRPLC